MNSMWIVSTCTCELVMFYSAVTHNHPFVFKARHFSGSAFCNFHRLGVPKQTLGGNALGFGIIIVKVQSLAININDW